MKRFSAALLGIALLVGFPLATGINAQDQHAGQAAYQAAERFFAQGDYRSARIEMLNAIQAAPNWPQARVRQAEIYLKLFDPMGAQAELRRAIDLGVKPDMVRHLMGDTFHQLGENVRARQWLTEGKIPVNRIGYAARVLADVELAMGNVDGARNAFDRALGIGADDSALWTSIARFRFATGDQGGAVNAVDHAVELDANNVRALQFRGELMRSQFGLASALPWFERALQIDPNDVPTLEEYGATLGDMGRMREMLDVARRILSLQPRNAKAFFIQAVLAARAGHFELAQNLLQKAGSSMERVPAFMQVEGVVEFQLGNYQKATERFDRLLAIQPHNQRTQTLLARSLYAQGDHAQLLDRFYTVANRNGSSAYMKTLVARSMEAIGDGDAALALLEDAREVDPAQLTMLDEREDAGLLGLAASRNPQDARSVIPFVRTLINQGNFDQALAEAERLADSNSGVPDAHVLVGDVQLLSNRPQAALEAYERAAVIRYSEPVLRRMVVVLKQVGRGDDAERVLLRFVGFNPANVAASHMLANVYIDYRNWPAAVAVLTALEKRVGPNNPAMLNDLALAQLRVGATSAAHQSARLSYLVQPSNALSTHIYGLTSSETASHDRLAVELLEKAQAMRPENPWLDYHLARAYVAVGAKGKAIGVLRGALAKGAFPEQDAAFRLLKKLRTDS